MMLHVSPLHLNRISSGIYYSSILFPPLNSRIIFFFLLLYLSPSCFYTSIFLPIPLPMFYILVLWVCLLFACCLLCSPLFWHLVLYVCITPRSDWCTNFTGQSPHKIKVCCVSLWIYTLPQWPCSQTFHHPVSAVHCLVVRPGNIY